jgi:pectate lyase
MNKYLKITTRLIFLLYLNQSYAASCPCDNGDQWCEPLDNNTTSILDNQDGWASTGTGITGGKSGKKIYWVTNLDQGKGPGTLRTALEASGRCSMWIKFDVSGTIKLKDEIQVNSNKTVDGRGAEITIDTYTDMTAKECASGNGGKKINGFEIDSEKNIAIINLTFDDNFDKWDGDCDGSDAIRIVNSKNVWIYHNNFKQWADGAIDIDSGSDKVTVASNKFTEIHQASAIRDGNHSFHHNYCNKVNHRCPHASFLDKYSDNGVYVHSANNLIDNWGANNIIQGKGKKAALLSEYDMFIPGSRTESLTIQAKKENGIADIKNAYDFGSSVNIEKGGKVDKQWKRYSRSLIKIEKCKSDSCFDQLSEKIEREAGASL